MKTITYCRNITRHLDAWQQRIDSAIRFMDGLDNDQKEDAYPLMRTLRQTLTEIGDERSGLDAICPAGWDTNDLAAGDRMQRLRETLAALSRSRIGSRVAETVAWV